MILGRGKRKKTAALKAAIVQSERGLQEAISRQEKVDALVGNLQVHGRRNHFAEKLEIAFGRIPK